MAQAVAFFLAEKQEAPKGFPFNLKYEVYYFLIALTKYMVPPSAP